MFVILWKIQGGGGVLSEIPFRGRGMDIFWNQTLFFCLHVNWPFFKPNIPLNSADGTKATRAN